MREFIPTRRGVAPPLPAASSFRNNEKDEGLASIMERRRQMADSEKVDTNDSHVGPSTHFVPRSSRMSITSSKKGDIDASVLNDDSKSNGDSESIPPSTTLNELQKAMLKRRKKVEDTTIPIVSPRQKRRSSKSEQNSISLMSPALQDKLQKQFLAVSDNSPQPSVRRSSKQGIEIPKVTLSVLSSLIPKSHVKSADNDDQSIFSSAANTANFESPKSITTTSRRASLKGSDSPKVALSVLPSPIPTSPLRSSVNNDDRSRVSSKSGSSGRRSTSQIQSTNAPSEYEGDSENDGQEDDEEEEIEEEIEEEEVEVESESEETETSVPNPDSDDEIFFSSEKYNGNRSLNKGNLQSDDDDDYGNGNNETGFSSDEGNHNDIAESSEDKSNTQGQFRQRREARRKKKIRSPTDSKNNTSNEESFHESGQTFFEPSTSTTGNHYPVVSDSEDEYDPFVITSFAHADSFNYRKVGKPSTDERSDGNNDDSADFDEVVEDDSEDDESGFESSSDKEIMSSDIFRTNGLDEASRNDQSFDEQTIEETLILDDEEEVEVTDDEMEDGLVDSNEIERIADNEQNENEFKDFGSDESDIEQQNLFGSEDSHGMSTLFTHSSHSRGNRSGQDSVELKGGSVFSDDVVVSGKLHSSSRNMHIPLGGDDDDSASEPSHPKNYIKSPKQLTYKARICSRPVLITLILIGSIVLGVCIGFFFIGGNDQGSSTALPASNNTTTKPAPIDITRSKIPSEHLSAYDSICPLLVNCSSLIDLQTSSGKAFHWLVNNLTANPDMDAIPNDKKIRRYALATIYFSTYGDLWVDNSNWLSDKDECEWFSTAETGSGCGIEGQAVFTCLELDMNNLKGELPYEISLLTSLTTLSIRNPGEGEQYLKGSFPSYIEKLRNLTTLVLTGNRFIGGIPPEIGSCLNLETVDLSNNGFNGEIPLTFSSLTNITTLNLEGNYFAGIIDPAIFEKTTNLVYLNLKGNQLTNLPETIVALDKLQTLIMGSNRLTSIPLVVTQLSTLKVLDISDNSISQSIPAQFGRMTSLSQLDLSNNKLIDAIPVEFGNLINLEELLDLSSNEISGTIPSRLGQLVRLRRLRLDGNRLSGVIPIELAALDKIEEIRLDDNNLEGTVPLDLCTLYNTIQPASYADCDELLDPTCITNCCTKESGCICQFEKSDPLLCIKNLN